MERLFFHNKIERLKPEQNKLVYFDSTDLHLGLFPVENKRRIIINFIVEV
jgi:hypothetical protein